MAKMRWSELSPRRRAVLLTLASIEVSLAATAWTDLARRPAEQVNGSKAKWAALIAVNFFGPIAYFRWGRRPLTKPVARRAGTPSRAHTKRG